jgi:hypothetical protein
MKGQLMAAVADKIEKPAAELLGDGATDELVALASIAISLKTLADAVQVLGRVYLTENHPHTRERI